MTSTSPNLGTQKSAPAFKRFIAHGWYEFLTTIRNGEQLLLSLILPALALVLLTRSSLITIEAASRIDVVAPGVIALAVMSSAFSGQAIATGFERRSGALRMFATTPLGRGGLLGGKVLGVLAVQVVQILVLGTIGLTLGWSPMIQGAAVAFGFVLLGTAAFTALGLLLAGTLRAEAVLAAANILWVLLMVGGGILLPGGSWARFLPSGALGDGLRQAFIHGGVDLGAVAILTCWTLVFTILTVRLFRWS